MITIHRMLFLLIIVASIVENSLESTTVECVFRLQTYDILGEIYECSMNNNPEMATQQSAIISSTKGIHEYLKSNDNVTGFRAISKKISFFPKGLEKKFANLKLIYIESCPIEQLRQSDLKEYSKLEYLCIYGSQLIIIEAGTFDYNSELKYLSLRNNKFAHIDQNAFQNLSKLVSFYLISVPCYDTYSRDRRGVEIMFSSLKTSCKNPGFLSMHGKFKNLEAQTKNLDFKDNLEIFEKEFNASSFAGITFFKARLNELKSTKIDESKGEINKDDNLCTKCCQNVIQGGETEMFVEDLQPKAAIFVEFLNKTEDVNSDDDKVDKNQQNLKLLQNNIKNSINDINTKIIDLKASNNDLKSALSQSTVELKNSIKSDLQTCKVELLSSQNDTKIILQKFRNDLASSQSSIKQSQDEVISDLSSIKATISDVETSLSKIKTSQNDLQSSVNKLRLSQNEMAVVMDRVGKNEGNDENFLKFYEKFQNVESHVAEFEAKFVEVNENLKEIKHDLANSRHKIEINFNEKLKIIEKRLMKNFEDVLEEKLVKIFDEKLKIITGSKN